MNGLPKKCSTPPRLRARVVAAGAISLALAVTAAAQEIGRDPIGVSASSDVIRVSELPRLQPGETGPRFGNKPSRKRVTGKLPAPSVAQRGELQETPRRFLDAKRQTATTAEEAIFTPATDIPSPPTSASFPGVIDNITAFNPDTQGAIGTNHMMTVTSSEVQFLDRLGGELSRVTLSNFWANIGTNGFPRVFDPRLVYDPYYHRWIQVAIANPLTNTAGLLIAVSASSDPTGSWYRHFLPVATTNANLYVDSPNLGFARDIVTVSANVFHRTNFDYHTFGFWAFGKTALYGGSAPAYTNFSLPSGTNGFGFVQQIPVPAVTYDSTVLTNYLVANWEGNTTDGGFLRVYYLGTNDNTGRLELTPGPFSTDTGAGGGGSPAWDEFAPGDLPFAPQSGTTNKIYMGDSRIQNCVYREDTLWLAHTIFLPAGGSSSRCSVQFWELTPGEIRDGTTNSAVVLQRSRIDDPTGVRFYAYPSVSVSRGKDVLIGYSRFAANQFPSANYSFRQDATEPLSHLRADVVLKAGEAKFVAPDQFGYTYWGDWSGAAIDPNNEIDLWTLQEYAATASGTNDRWGTWWGRVTPPTDVSVTISGSPGTVIAGSNITYTITVTTTNLRLQPVTGVRAVDTLPAGAVLNSVNISQGTWGLTNGVVTCDFGTVGVTGRVTATIVATLYNTPTAQNSVTASSYGPEITPANNVASINTTVSPASELNLALSESTDPVIVSNTLVYTLTVSNGGPSSATTTLLTNTLPPNVTFISHTPSQGTCSRNGSVVNCSLGTLATGAVATVQIQFAPNGPGTLTNRASVVSASVDVAPGNNTNLTFTLANARPTIGTISDRTINEDGVLSAVSFTIGDFETPAGSLVLTGFCSNPAIVPAGNIVFGGSGSSRTITVTPALNANGTCTVTRIVSDALGATATNSFLLTVLPMNDPPTINDTANFAIDEDTSTNILITIGDVETSATVLTVSAASSNTVVVPNANLTFVPGGGATRTLSIRPATNQFGSTIITVTVSDGTNTTSDNFLLTVTGVNDPPSITSISNRSVNEDTSTGPIAFTVADFETTGSNLVVTAFSLNTNMVPNANLNLAIVSGGTNRTLTVLPGTNQFGVVNIGVRVADTDGTAVSNQFQLTINAVNDPPSLAAPANLTTNEDAGAITVTLTGIGPGATNETQGVFITAVSDNTSLIPNPSVNYSPGSSTGSLSFSSALNSNGVATITVTATDDGASNNVTVRMFTVTVTAVNDPPVISDITNRSIDEDTSTAPISFTVGDVDNAATALSLSKASSNESIVPAGNIVFGGSGSNRTVTVTPAPNANGLCTITVFVTDGQTTNSDAFHLTVLPINDPPTISAIADRTINEDSSTNITFTVGDLETVAGNLTVVASSSNQGLVSNGSLTTSGPGATRTVSVTPVANQFGTATITLVVSDLEGGTNATTFNLTVLGVNDPPTLATISDVTVTEDDPQQSITLTGISGGPGGEPQSLTFSAVSSSPAIVPHPTIGYTNGNSTAVLRFTPVANASGDATITVTVDDGGTTNRTASQAFVIHVLPENDLPVISEIPPQSTPEDATMVVSFWATDIETSVSNLTFIANSSNQELIQDSDLVVTRNGTNFNLSLRALTNAFGSGEILLQVTDGDAAVAFTTFELTVTSVNDSPSISAISNVATNEDASTGPIAFTIDDPDHDISAVSVTAQSSNPALVPTNNLTLGGSGRNRTITAVPVAHQFGAATITITVSDGSAASSNSFTVTFASVNDLPTLSDLPDVSINEDGVLGPIALSIDDIETTTDALTLSVSSSDAALVPTNNVSFGGSGASRTLTVTPVANRSGSATLTITVTDANAGSSSDTFVLSVNAVNDLPTLGAIANVTTNEDSGPFTVALSGIGAGPNESQSLTVTATSSDPALIPHPAVSYASPNPTGSLTLTPAANSNGTADITVTVTDSATSNNVVSQVFTVTVLAVNDPPTLDLLPDLTLAEDSPEHTVNLTGIGTGMPNEAQPLTISASYSNPLQPILTAPVISYTSGNPTGTLRFTPLNNATGSVIVTVTVTDNGVVNSNFSRAFTVTVTNINDAPFISGVPVLEVPEDTLTNMTFTIGDVDTPLANLVVTAVSLNQALVPDAGLVPGGSGANRSLAVTPVPDQSGTANISITVQDGAGGSITTTVPFLVNAVNDPPTLNSIAGFTIAEDAPEQTVNLSGISSGALNEPQTLSVTAISGAPAIIPHPVVTYTSGDATGSLRFTPLPNATGAVSITVTVSESGPVATNFSRSFIVTVTNINDPPSITSIANQITPEDVPTAALSFTVGDLETPAANLSLSVASSNPTVVSTNGITFGGSGANRTVTVLPVTNQVGSAQITVTVRDAEGAMASTAFLLTVTDADDPPTISNIADRSAPEDAPVVVSFTISDLETTAANLAVNGTSSNPMLVPNSAIVFGGSGSSRTVTLTPLANQVGSSTITVTVTDSSGLSASDAFVLTITNLNDPPSISGLPALTINEDTATGPLSFTMGDIETTAASLGLTTNSSNASLLPNANIATGGSGANRTVTLTPSPNQNGNTTITLTVNDGNGGTTNTSFVLTVAPVNDPPTLDPIGDRTAAEDATAQAVSLTGISAGPNEVQSLSITAVSGNPSVVPNPSVLFTNSTGVLTFTPVPNATGVALITVTVNDGAASNNSIVRTFSITVTPAGDPPAIAGIATQSMLEDTVLTVPITLSDPDTAGLSLVLSASSTNTTVLPATNIFFSGAGTNRTVTFVPQPNRFGTSLVTIAVSDGVLSNSTSFLVNVISVNDPPTLNQLTNVNIAASPGTLTLPLQGISAGATGETETVTFSTTNNAPAGFWTTVPTVTYSGGTTGLLTYRSANSQTGVVTVAVLANDGRASNNITVRTFLLNVRRTSSPANIPPTLSTIGAQTINEDVVLGPLSFTVRDAETSVSNLIVTALSTNEALFPPANIVFGGGNGSNRNVTLTPAANRSGVSLISLTVRDGNGGASNMNFTVTVNGANDVPTVSSISTQSTPENTPTQPILFNVTDVETAPGSLTVTATSANQNLVPNANITLGGGGTNRAMVITPAANTNGSVLITVTVSDGAASTNTSFVLTINAVNDPPTISDIANQTTAEATSTGPVAFTVADPDTPLANLLLTAASTNPSLIPTSNISFGGSGGSRTVTLAPLANQSGSATITLSVSDGASTNSDTFVLTVNAVNDTPTLNAIGDVTVNQNAPLQTVPLAGITSGNASESQTLIVAASSSNPSLIPHPTVNYTSPGATGNLTFTPAPNMSGTATITVTVNDGQPQNNIVTRTFIVTVNGAPTVSLVANQIVSEDSVSGAIAFIVGDAETPAANLVVSRSSSNPAIVPTNNLALGGSGANRTLTITPLPNVNGHVFITLTVADANGNTVNSTFLVTVAPVNDPPTLDALTNLSVQRDSGQRTVNLTGIGSGAANESQSLSITALSLNPSIIPNPAVTYVSPNPTGMLAFQPVAGATGVVTIVITVDDGQTANNLTTRTFTVNVQAVPPTLTIRRLSGTDILLSWPAAYAGFTLEHRPNVASGTWTDVTGSPVVIDGTNNVIQNATGPFRVYRLRNP